MAKLSETDSDDMASNNSESLLFEARTKKKRKLNSSSGGGAKLVSDDADEIDYTSLPEGVKTKYDSEQSNTERGQISQT